MFIPPRFIPVALFFALAASACSDNGDSRQAVTPSPTEIADLQYMREEEKLARDVYLMLYEEWGAQVFSNIATSEQTHTDAVAKTLELFGLEDPVVDDTIGVFVDPRLVELYDEMINAGLKSSLEALHVGATIEEVDMVDIQSAVERADDPRIIALYEALLCGSRNHLRAFTSELDNAGHPYTAQFLDPAEVEAIISAPLEQCGA